MTPDEEEEVVVQSPEDIDVDAITNMGGMFAGDTPLTGL